MNIVYIASEIVPFASTGGLADIGSALPRALTRHGVQVWRVMPLYRQIAEGPYDLKDTGLRLEVPVGFKMHRAEVWMTEEPAPPTFFIRRDEFFDRTQLYSLPDRDYDDNFERFVFFQKTAVALIDALSLHPDIVHLSDWQTGLVPLFLKHGIQGMGRECTEKAVFTIHNLAYQGIFPGSLYSLTNLPFFCFNVSTAEFYGNVNCMKSGITTSDVVTTVSKTYAQEIQAEEAGLGLHGVLSRLGDRLVGILHGADYDVWDPSKDEYISARFSADDLGGKRACKEDLLKEMGLTIPIETPLIGLVTRLVDHKGMDILADAMAGLMSRDVAFVILGMGQEKYHGLCEQWARQWPGRFAVRLGYDNPLAHRIEAGVDLYLMPSRFEPCGLNQLYSLRYGTIPIVHATGGLEDTIEDIGPGAEQGTGFKFKSYTPDGLLSAVDRALELMRDGAKWSELMKRAMSQDFSWDRSADEHLKLYKRILS